MDSKESRATFVGLYAGLRRRPDQPLLDCSESDDCSVSSHSDSNEDASQKTTLPSNPSKEIATTSFRITSNSSTCRSISRDDVNDNVNDEISDASSDAATVEPEEYELTERCLSRDPSSPSIRNSESFSGPNAQGFSTPVTCHIPQENRTPPTLPPPSSPAHSSGSSSAETIPPPSPAAMSRVNLTTSSVPALIVDPDDESKLGTAVLMDQSPSKRPFPRFSDSQFRFRKTEEPVGDLQLSDQKNSPQLQLPTGSGCLPASIANELSQYQRDGVTFLYRLFERRRGGLLADAMGLGKTVQTICFLGVAFGVWDRVLDCDSVYTQDFTPRVLIIVPASVRENWKREFECWTPFRVTLYDRNREPEISRAFRDGKLDVLIASDHPISNYTSFFKDPLNDKQTCWEWHVIIIDEIHVAKNASTKIYKALQSIPRISAFGLTGTAVQNRLSELWNVLSLVVPESCLPSYKIFRSHFIDVINKGTKKDATAYMRQKADQRIFQLRNLLSKHMVRRPKSILDAQLPGKTDYCVLMRMKRDGLQGYMYHRFQNSYDVKLLRNSKSPCDCGSGEASKECCHRYPVTETALADAPIWKIHHEGNVPCEKCPNCICLSVQYYSRCIAAHAFLLMPEDDEVESDKAAVRKILLRYYLGKYANRMDEPLERVERDRDVSCKLNVALKLIRNYQQTGHKTIIFYESLRLGAILQRWATNKGILFEVIDGSVNKGLRQTAVDRFNDDTLRSVFFISKKAGGTGLNICGADRVLIFEPCWNPTMDLQAGDRAHRLGQKRGVQIIRFVVENTIEHYVLKTAISKAQVSSAILDNTKEEWRVRDDEVGSMHAMLNMGNVFSETSQDHFDIVKAEHLNVVRTGESNQGQENKNSSFLSDDNDDDLEAPQVDVLGDQVVCALDVDLEDVEWVPTARPKISTKQIDSARDNNVEEVEEFHQFQESQMVSDLLGKAGAAKQMVIMSTSARKKRRQLLGVGKVNCTGGINANGTKNVNIDEAKWKPFPNSQIEEEEEEEEEKEVIGAAVELPVKDSEKRSFSSASQSVVEQRMAQSVVDRLRKRRKRPIVVDDDSQHDIISKTEKVRLQTSDLTGDTQTKVKSRGKRGDKDGPKNSKPVSAFAARARIRR